MVTRHIVLRHSLRRPIATLCEGRRGTGKRDSPQNGSPNVRNSACRELRCWIESAPKKRLECDLYTSQKFVQDYKARFNQDADQFAAQAYTGVYVLADAIKRANLTGDSAKDRDALRAALANTKDLPTILGSFSFLPSRDANHPPVVQEVDKNGNFVLYQ